MCIEGGKFVYIDCLYVPVKKDLISAKTAIYVMLGINRYGQKEVMGIWINETESATFWTRVFEEIKDRGVEDILFVSMDGLTGLADAIEKIYPKTRTQRCIVHIVRNIYSILNKNKVKSIIQDRKIIYTTNPIESLNSCLRKVTRGKGSFISMEALLKVLYLRIRDLEKSWSKGTRNWNNVQNQLIELFGNRILKYYT